MISKTRAYKTSDGQTFEKAEEAQVHEIALLLRDDPSTEDLNEDYCHELAERAIKIVKHRDQILDILTLNSKSRLGARKLHGAKRTAKKAKSKKENDSGWNTQAVKGLVAESEPMETMAQSAT